MPHLLFSAIVGIWDWAWTMFLKISPPTEMKAGEIKMRRYNGNTVNVNDNNYDFELDRRVVDVNMDIKTDLERIAWSRQLLGMGDRGGGQRQKSRGRGDPNEEENTLLCRMLRYAQGSDSQGDSKLGSFTPVRNATFIWTDHGSTWGTKFRRRTSHIFSMILLFYLLCWGCKIWTPLTRLVSSPSS